MPNPSVSVIITTFNRPALLRGAISGVLKQDFAAFELIVVDDCSPGEETGAIVSSFSDPRIRYMRNMKNEGGTASLNRGLSAAHGAYVAILDDDDEWSDSQKLSKQIAFFESHPEHVLLGTNILVVHDVSGEELGRSNAPADDANIRKTFFKNNPFAHSSIMFRREAALKAHGYEPTLPRGKDYDLCLKLGALGKMAVLPDICVRYREALPVAAKLIEKRLTDARASLKVIKRHRKEYPGFLRSYLGLCARIVLFIIFSFFPFIYSALRKIKDRG